MSYVEKLPSSSPSTNEDVSELVAAAPPPVPAKGLRPRWLFNHPQDIHCVMFHLFVVAGYLTAFYLDRHPQLAHLESPWARGAFWLASTIMLGWVSGINVGVNFHNHVHLRIFRRAWQNRWFGRFWSITGGWPSFFWKYAHVHVHHANTLEDRDWTLPRRNADGKFEGYWKYCLLHWPWRYAIHIWRDWRSGVCGASFRDQAGKELAIFLVLYSLPFIIDWKMGLFLWFAPHLFGNALIMGSGMYVQHVDCEPVSTGHRFRHSNTFFSRFFNLAMFNIGYHNLHHSFAHVHWSDLPETQRRLQAAMDADGAKAVSIGYFRASVECAQGRDWPHICGSFPPAVADQPDAAGSIAS